MQITRNTVVKQQQVKQPGTVAIMYVAVQQVQSAAMLTRHIVLVQTAQTKAVNPTGEQNAVPHQSQAE